MMSKGLLCVIFGAILAHCDAFVLPGFGTTGVLRKTHSGSLALRAVATPAKPPQKQDITPVAVAPPSFSVSGKTSSPMVDKMEQLLREAQDFICASVEKSDGQAKFIEDAYLRENGGGGRTRVLSNGNVWEKAGIGLAVVHGNLPAENLEKKAGVGDRSKFKSIDRKQGFKEGEKIPFVAVGLSSVMHPKNPHCPTMHFNYRYFETASGLWWFGGGQDITPAYLDEEDMRHFHGTLKTVCDKHDDEFYPYFKAWADDYYRIPHRNETRGLGGIFYDDLNDRDPEEILKLQRDLVMSVPDAYIPIIEKHRDDAYTQQQDEWKQIRRGRYVEFNLVYDRGTIFGLKTGLGRTESILMTLPETARWEYDHQVLPGSPEAEITDAFRFARNWV